MDESDLTCPQCSHIFNDLDRIPRLLPECGHTLCTSCLGRLLQDSQNVTFSCPEDQVEYSTQKKVEDFPKNFALIRLLSKTKQRQIPPPSNHAGGEKEEENDLDMCKQHNRKLEVICIDDKVRLCTSCALFGGHKNHDVRMEDDVIKEITMRAEFLLEIYSLVTESEQLFQRKTEVEKMYTNFKTKETNLKETVANKFQELRNAINTIEAKTKETMNKAFGIIEDKFKRIRDIPHFLEDKTSSWKKAAEEKMRILSGANENDCLAFELLENRKEPEKDIIHLGEQILETIGNLQFDQSLEETHDFIDKINIQIDSSIFQVLPHFCTIKVCTEEIERKNIQHSKRFSTFRESPPPDELETQRNGHATDRSLTFDMKDIPFHMASPKNIETIGEVEESEMLLNNISNLSLNLDQNDYLPALSPFKRNNSTTPAEIKQRSQQYYSNNTTLSPSMHRPSLSSLTTSSHNAKFHTLNLYYVTTQNQNISHSLFPAQNLSPAFQHSPPALNKSHPSTNKEN